MRGVLSRCALLFALVGLCACLSAQERDVHPEVGKILDRAPAATGAERVRILTEALNKARAVKDRIGEGTALLLQGLDLQSANKQTAAKELLSKAAKMGFEEDFPYVEMLARNGLGLLYLTISEHRTSLAQYERVVQLAEKTRKEDMLAIAFNGQGLCLFGLGESNRALPLYRRSLEISRRLQMGTQLCAVQNNLAICLASTGGRSEAITLLKEALPLAIEIKNDDLHARTLYHFGLMYEVLSDYPRAHRWLNDALEVASRTSNTALEALIRTALAVYFSGIGKHEQSINSNRTSIELFIRLGQFEMLPVLFNNIALSQALLKRYSEATKSMAEAMKWQAKSGNRHNEPFLLMNLGALALLQEQPDLARFKFSQALPLGTVTGDAGVVANTLALLAGTYQSSNPDYAIALLKLSVTKLQALRADLKSEASVTREAFKKGVEGSYQQLADLLVLRGRLTEAQQVLDLLKEDEFASFVSRSRNPTSSPELNQAESSNETRYKSISDRVGLIGEEYAKLLAKERAGLASEAEMRRIKVLGASIESIRLEFSKFLDLAAKSFAKSDPKHAAIEDIKNTGALKKSLRSLTEQSGVRTVAIYTVTAESRLHLILITPELQDVVTLPIGEAALRRKIFAFRQVLLQPTRDPRPLGKELYDILVAPIEKKLGGTQTAWLWSLDGSLRYLPLGALWSGEHYAVELRSQSVITPAGQADLTAKPDVWSALAFGMSRAMESQAEGEVLRFPALPEVTAEIGDIGRSIPTISFLDAQFSRDSFFDQIRLGKHAVVHVATHFHFEPGRDDSSFLVLGKGGLLHLSEISQKIDTGLFEGVELLTLSACDTALSSGADGRDFEGFAALAQRAGVRSVLASLWPVSDASTRVLMAQFYANRGATPQLSKSEALRRAQVSMIRGDLTGDANVRGVPTKPPILDKPGLAYPKDLPTWSHPYYWAPFVLLGNSR